MYGLTMAERAEVFRIRHEWHRSAALLRLKKRKVFLSVRDCFWNKSQSQSAKN